MRYLQFSVPHLLKKITDLECIVSFCMIIPYNNLVLTDEMSLCFLVLLLACNFKKKIPHQLCYRRFLHADDLQI